MADEKILDEEIMSDEELDNVAGGMYEATTTIQAPNGLHARTELAPLVQAASQFKSTNIRIWCKGKTVDAKNILMLMSMGLRNGYEIKILADGPDEEKAVKTLTDMFNNNFGRN